MSVNKKLEIKIEQKSGVLTQRIMFGHMDPFVIGNDFVEYEMRLQQFFIANEVADAKKVPLFIIYLGADAYSILRKLISPADPSTKTYSELVKELKKFFEPDGNEIAESFKFYKAEQGSKTMMEYIIELKYLAEKCNFNSFLERALRDRFVCGVRDSQLRSKFLKESNLSFKTACETALNWEMAEGENKEIAPKCEMHNTCAVRQGHNVRTVIVK